MSQIAAGRKLRRFKPRKLIAQSTSTAWAVRPSRVRAVAVGPLLTMCWLGLLAGLLELALVAGQRAFIARISLDSLRMNRYFVWMIPGADLLLFGVVGLILALPSRRYPEKVRTLTRYIGPGLLAIALLQAVEALGAIAGLVLAIGITYRSQPYIRRHAQLLARVIRGTLLPLACVPVVLAVAGTYGVVSSERRALNALPPVTAPAGKNVVLMVLDDVRADSMSLYGHDRPTTPRLEQLSRDAVVFDAARSTASWTLPSHASMFTGQWPHRTSIDWNLGLDRTHTTLAEWLAAKGYATAGFVANTYYCNARYGLDRGFARYEDFHENLTVSVFEMLRCSSLGKAVLRGLGYSMNFAPGEAGSRKSAAIINRDALAWVDRRPADRPFFLFLNYYDAHGPFIPPDDATERFGTCALPRSEQVEILKRGVRAASDPKLSAAERARFRQESEAIRIDGYESCIAYLDQQIGNLFDELRRRGLLEDTLVIVTSDHGEHFQERGFSGHGQSLYRREVHVPLLIFPPAGAPERRRIDDPASLRDLPATVADLLQHEASPFPGRSLARFWESTGQEDSEEEDVVLSELGHQSTMAPNPGVPATMGTTRALTADRAVLIRSSSGKDELYDRLEDPHEQRNLIDVHPDRHPVAREKDRLIEIMNSPGF